MKQDDQDSTVPARPAETFGSAPTPTQSMGSAPDESMTPQSSRPGSHPGPAGGGSQTFGTAPEPTQSMGGAPASGGRNLPLLLGGGVALLVVLAVIIGLIAR